MPEEELERKAEESKAAEAAEDKSAEIQNEEKSPEEVAEEERVLEEHKAKSKQGRQIAQLRADNEGLKSTLNTILSRLPDPAKAEPLDPDQPLDVKTLLKLQAQEKAKENSQIKEYGQSYTDTVRELVYDDDSELSEEDQVKMYDILTSEAGEFNRKSDDNPVKAAAKNFNRAERSMRSATPKKEINLKKDKDLPPGGGPSTPAAKDKKEIVLTDEEKDYARRRGLTEEEVKKRLSRADVEKVYQT